jgi:hypothetical protein
MSTNVLSTAAAVIGVVVAFKWATEDSGDKIVEKCIHARYADMYNKDKFGSPQSTFIRCMEINYPKTHERIKALYEPPAAAQAPMS